MMKQLSEQVQERTFILFSSTLWYHMAYKYPQLF